MWRHCSSRAQASIWIKFLFEIGIMAYIHICCHIFIIIIIIESCQFYYTRTYMWSSEIIYMNNPINKLLVLCEILCSPSTRAQHESRTTYTKWNCDDDDNNSYDYILCSRTKILTNILFIVKVLYVWDAVAFANVAKQQPLKKKTCAQTSFYDSSQQ